MAAEEKPADSDDEARLRRRAAELLAQAELFSGLDRITLAKLAANLDRIAFTKGDAACEQGEAGDSLYLVLEGIFGVYVHGGDERPAIRVAELTSGGCFGEMALLTGEPRSASVIADSDGALLRLDHERFAELVQRDPNIGLALSASLSRRLRVASQNIKNAEQFIRSHAETQLRAMPAPQRAMLLRASMLPELDDGALSALFEAQAAEVKRLLNGLGWHAGKSPAALATLLREAHAQELGGADALRAAHRGAVAQLADAQVWPSALSLAEDALAQEEFLPLLNRAIAEKALLNDEQLAKWLKRLNDDDVAAHPDLRDVYHRSRELLRARDLAPRPSLPSPARKIWSRLSARPSHFAAVITAALLIFAAIVTAPQSKPIAFVLLLGAAIVLWIVAVFPEFVVYLGLVVAWVFLGIAAPAQAVAGFGSTSWISIFAILAIGAALAESGLVFRLGLLLVRRLPKTLLLQGAAYLGSGVLLTLLVPASAARARLLLPTALAAAQAQRFRDRSPEAAFLGLSAFVGAGPLLYTFLNGSSSNFLGLGLIPEAARARFDLAFWFVAAAPLALFVSIGTLAVLWLVLRPGKTHSASHGQIDLQLSLLGKTTGHEIAMGFILFALVVGWNVGPRFGLNPAIIGLASVVAAALAGCLNRRSLQELNWDFLISFGVVLSLPPIMSSLGIDAALSDGVRRLIGDVRLSPAVFVLAIAAINIALRFMLPRGQTVFILAIILIPIAPIFGVHPWIVVITVLATFTLWILPNQSVSYAVAYEAAEERLFSHRQARAVCVGFIVVTLLGLLASLPYWRWLGLA